MNASGTLGNDVLKIAVLEMIPFMTFDNSSGVVKLKTGTDVELILTLAAVMNFSFQILPSVDGKWGVRSSNGSWTGLIGMVHRKEADMAISFTFITEGRSKVVDFSVPYGFPSTKIITKAGKTVSLKTIIFLRAYNGKMWILIGLAVIFAMAVLYILCKVHKGRRRIYRPLWFVCSSMMLNASQKDVPSNGSTRVFVISLWIFAFLIMNIFSGQLISNITLAQRDQPIDTIDNLVQRVKRRDYKFHLMRSTATSDFILKSTSGPFRYLGDMLRKNDHWMTNGPLQSIQRVHAERSAYIGATHIETIALANNMSLHFSKDVVIANLQGIVLSKQFKQKEVLNKWISRIFEAGLCDKWKMNTYHSLFGLRHLKQVAPKHLVSREVNLMTMKDLKYAFCLPLFGYLIAWIVVIFEKIEYKCLKK